VPTVFWVFHEVNPAGTVARPTDTYYRKTGFAGDVKK
jgi:hypothetical protein